MIRHIPIAITLVALSVGEAQQKPPAQFQRAQTERKWEPKYDFIAGRELVSSTDWLARNKRSVGGETMWTSGDAQTTYLLVRRTVTSQPEVHARWDDIVIMRAGTGVIIMGDSLVGSTLRAPGERVGGQMNRMYQLVVHAGDIVRIPAATPHMFIVAGSEPLHYLLIKQRRQDLPIRWFVGVGSRE
jgi:mannose-6-phosphate isomerase-like protein (cupin superfamily)